MPRPARRRAPATVLAAALACWPGLLSAAEPAPAGSAADRAAVGAEDRAAILDLMAQVTQFREFNECAAEASRFLPDGVFEIVADPQAPARVLRGRDQIQADCQAANARGVLNHVVGNVRLVRVDARRVQGLSQVLVGARSPQSGSLLSFSLADYVDEFVRTPEGWRLARRHAQPHASSRLPREFLP